MTAAAPRATLTTAEIDTEGVLTAEALDLVATLQRTYAHARTVLLRRRRERAEGFRAGVRPGLDPATADIRAGDWRVPAAPADLADRRCEITGPADRKMMVSALNSGARVFLCDLEDALAPTWANIVAGHRNIRDYALGTLSFTRPDGRVDQVTDGAATVVVRPRGLHLDESRVEVDGGPVAAGLFDIAVAATLAGPALAARGSGLYLYLPKMESWHEAQWWDALLGDVERRVGLPPRSIRVTVLIETITAAFEMEEILFALRHRVTGLNAGRWDYIFSLIKKFGTDPAFILPDRRQVTMTVPFLAEYAQRLVAVCHKRGAHAIGGMAALIPSRRDASANERAISAVRADKQREADLGYDGTWVAHPDLVPMVTEVFDRALGEAADQLHRVPEPSDHSGWSAGRHHPRFGCHARGCGRKRQRGAAVRARVAGWPRRGGLGRSHGGSRHRRNQPIAAVAMDPPPGTAPRRRPGDRGAGGRAAGRGGTTAGRRRYRSGHARPRRRCRPRGRSRARASPVHPGRGHAVAPAILPARSFPHFHAGRQSTGMVCRRYSPLVCACGLICLRTCSPRLAGIQTVGQPCNRQARLRSARRTIM